MFFSGMLYVLVCTLPLVSSAHMSWRWGDAVIETNGDANVDTGEEKHQARH